MTLSDGETWFFFKYATLSLFVILVALEVFIFWQMYKQPMPWMMLWGALSLILGGFIAWFAGWGFVNFWLWNKWT